MQTLHTISELRAQVSTWRRAGDRIAFVPTMGNLHRGHIELVARARALGDRVVASVFVNPLQFGPGEDFGRYPRTLPDDAHALAAGGCDVLFAPSAGEIYPRGMDGLTLISVPQVSTILCGHFRPGHFDGVATVVAILFDIVQPQVALFGEKDYQQLRVIRRMVADLHLPIEIVGVATQREADGLALSSRNQYLSAGERVRAPLLYQCLREAAAALQSGRRDFAVLAAAASRRLEDAGFRPQYVEIRAPDLADPRADAHEFVVLAAAYLGATRLIDNLGVGETPV